MYCFKKCPHSDGKGKTDRSQTESEEGSEHMHEVLKHKEMLANTRISKNI